jgi:glyoxylase-like metal-dependent hydrolase (beta-lactamase superfamily II)
MQLVFEQIRGGGDRNFGYLLGDRSARRAVLIDPSFSPDAFVARATEQGLDV